MRDEKDQLGQDIENMDDKDMKVIEELHKTVSEQTKVISSLVSKTHELKEHNDWFRKVIETMVKFLRPQGFSMPIDGEEMREVIPEEDNKTASNSGSD